MFSSLLNSHIIEKKCGLYHVWKFAKKSHFFFLTENIFFSCFFEKLIENNIFQKQKMRLFRNIFTYCVFVSSHSSKYYSTSISVKPKKQNCVEILPFQFAQKLAFKTRNISQRLSKKILYRNTDRETLFCVVNERCEKRKKKYAFFSLLTF